MEERRRLKRRRKGSAGTDRVEASLPARRAMRKRRKAARRRRRMQAVAMSGILLILLLIGVWGHFSGKHRSGAGQSAAESAGDQRPGTESTAGDPAAGDNISEGSGAEGETVKAASQREGGEEGESGSAGEAQAEVQDAAVKNFFSGYRLQTGAGTQTITNSEVNSSYGVLINLKDGTVTAQREADTVINPASMTKIMTVLVAAEHVKNLDDRVTITQEITDFIYKNDASMVGFAVGESVPVRDLFYGTILPSGADAALALANYCAGSQENFVALMNQKAEQLGIAGTAHFGNCIGLYAEDNHCTVKDMAIILKAALENDLAREALTAHTYTTTATEQHPEGITISNWFLRRIEDKDTHGKVICAKTGYVVQSGNCAASYQVSNSGIPYICVTGNAHSAWRCIYDHVAIYDEFTS